MKLTIDINSLEDSAQCDFNFNGELYFYNDRLASILYSCFVSIVTLIQLAFTYRMIKNHNSGRILVQKISLTTITVCTIQDFYLAMTHVYFVILKDVSLCLK